MRITRLLTRPVAVPFDAPIETAIHSMTGIYCVLVRLETDQGLVGEGYLFTLDQRLLPVFDEMVHAYADFVIGQDPNRADDIWQAIWRHLNPTGHKGVTISALSAIDTACWDLVGKQAGKPLHQIFGACRDRIPTYASGGLWLSQPAEDCAREAGEFVAEGFCSVKLRVGSERTEDDVERARLVRDAIGPDTGLLVDANQALSVEHAIRLGRALEEFDIGWLEEPVPYYDLAGHAEVRKAQNLPVATGETEFTRHGIKAIIDADAADILMPDLQRIGGISEFRHAAALAAEKGLPVSSHIFTEHSLCLAGSLSNCISVEHMPWAAPLFHEEMQIEDGDIVIPQRPGCGFTFNDKAVDGYALGPWRSD